MQRIRVVLLCSRHLLGESLEHILRNASELELVGAWDFEDWVFSRLAERLPDLLIITEDEPPDERTALFTAKILDGFPDLPIIRVALAQNILRIYTSRMLPARRADFMDVIHLLSGRSYQDNRENAPGEDGGEVHAS
jgi:hypothetical protein